MSFRCSISRFIFLFFRTAVSVPLCKWPKSLRADSLSSDYARRVQIAKFRARQKALSFAHATTSRYKARRARSGKVQQGNSPERKVSLLPSPLSPFIRTARPSLSSFERVRGVSRSREKSEAGNCVGFLNKSFCPWRGWRASRERFTLRACGARFNVRYEPARHVKPEPCIRVKSGGERERADYPLQISTKIDDLGAFSRCIFGFYRNALSSLSTFLSLSFSYF